MSWCSQFCHHRNLILIYLNFFYGSRVKFEAKLTETRAAVIDLEVERVT
jgi:hypothetical protein